MGGNETGRWASLKRHDVKKLLTLMALTAQLASRIVLLQTCISTMQSYTSFNHWWNFFFSGSTPRIGEARRPVNCTISNRGLRFILNLKPGAPTEAACCAKHVTWVQSRLPVMFQLKWLFVTAVGEIVSALLKIVQRVEGIYSLDETGAGGRAEHTDKRAILVAQLTTSPQNGMDPAVQAPGLIQRALALHLEHLSYEDHLMVLDEPIFKGVTRLADLVRGFDGQDLLKDLVADLAGQSQKTQPGVLFPRTVTPLLEQGLDGHTFQSQS